MYSWELNSWHNGACTEAQLLVLDYSLSTQQNRLSTNNDTHIQSSMKDRRRASPPIVATYFSFPINKFKRIGNVHVNTMFSTISTFI